MDNPCPPVICFRLDVYVHLVCPPPRGVTDFKAALVKGTKTMPADVVFSGVCDVDPNAVTHTLTVLLNGAAVGSVTLPSTPSTPFTFNYSQLVPPGPVLAAGNTVQGSDVTTDNQSPPLSSPAILSNTVTIQAAQPAPTGVTGFAAQQVGAP
jgi:hypothetical protein